MTTRQGRYYLWTMDYMYYYCTTLGDGRDACIVDAYPDAFVFISNVGISSHSDFDAAEFELFKLDKGPSQSSIILTNKTLITPIANPCTEISLGLHTLPRCECGKDKHGFMAHSDWCPKHESKVY